MHQKTKIAAYEATDFSITLEFCFCVWYNKAKDFKKWTGMDLHKRAKCGIICISGIEKGYTIARFLRIFDEIFDYAQCRKDAKWFGYFGKTEEKLAFLLALAMH